LVEGKGDLTEHVLDNVQHVYEEKPQFEGAPVHLRHPTRSCSANPQRISCTVLERTAARAYLEQHVYLCSRAPENFQKERVCVLEHDPTDRVQENARPVRCINPPRIGVESAVFKQ